MSPAFHPCLDHHKWSISHLAVPRPILWQGLIPQKSLWWGLILFFWQYWGPTHAKLEPYPNSFFKLSHNHVSSLFIRTFKKKMYVSPYLFFLLIKTNCFACLAKILQSITFLSYPSSNYI